MRFALISDIHANVHALGAVLEDVGRRGLLDHTYHLGDLVGYAPFPDETVELIRSSAIPGVAGNYDSTVATAYEHCGCKYEDPEQERLSHISYEWTQQHTSSASKAFLGGLPFRLDLRPGGGHRTGPTLVLVHGTPTLNTLYWHDQRPDDFCRKMGARAGVRAGDVVAFGHTHVPWFREVDGIHYLNTGSVGRPKDGNWRSSYAILDFGEGGPKVEFPRVEYDLGAAMQAIRESTLPDFFAEYLAAGGKVASTEAGGDRA